MELLGEIIGTVIGLGLGVVFVIPLLVLVFGSGLAGAAKIIESILG